MLRRRARHLAISLVTTGIVLAAAVNAGAGDTTGLFEPGGSIEAISNGRLTFGSSPAIQCNFTLDGSLEAGDVELVEGQALGSVTGLSVANCSGGSFSATLNAPWTLRVAELPESPEALSTTLEGVAFNLTTFGGFVNCLYSGNLGLVFELVGSGPRAVEAVIVDESVPLVFVRGSGFCPDESALSGQLALAPAQEFAGPIKLECRGVSGEGGLTFATVNPGGISTRRVICRYVNGDPIIRVSGTTGIVGAGAAAYRAEGIPAGGTLMSAGDSFTITVRFAPEEGAPRDTSFVADFKFATDYATRFVPLIARTAP